MKLFIGLAAIAAAAGSASAGIVISEVLGSTTGVDAEFIELCNMGPGSVDISGWKIELWDSDVGGSFGGADGGSPYTVTAGTILAPGAVWVICNNKCVADYAPFAPFVPNQIFPDNSIENSSYTMILVNGATVIDSVFVTDGGAGDSPNRGGVAFVPNLTVGPDGAVLPAGFARNLTGADIIDFDGYANPALRNDPYVLGTPGVCQIPAPLTGSVLALGGLLAARRRR